MSLSVIQAIADNILAHIPRAASPTIVWHGGEPTTVPLRWYEEAQALLNQATPQQTTFSMQTNGAAIDEKWVEFLSRTKTNVSLSVDGPREFHDQRRKTRGGGPTWHLVMNALRRLQKAGLDPAVITVLSPQSLDHADEFYQFYKENAIKRVSFSIDEREGKHSHSSFEILDYKKSMVAFIKILLTRAYEEGFLLYVREVERIASVLTKRIAVSNEQVQPWKTLTITADGQISTFSPELTEVKALRYHNFLWSDVFTFSAEDVVAANKKAAFDQFSKTVANGVSECRSKCSYYSVCGGGAPVNKFCELGSAAGTETMFCRLSVQAAKDALEEFLQSRWNRRATLLQSI
jgi:uncharacterized protein